MRITSRWFDWPVSNWPAPLPLILNFTKPRGKEDPVVMRMASQKREHRSNSESQSGMKLQ